MGQLLPKHFPKSLVSGTYKNRFCMNHFLCVKEFRYVTMERNFEAVSGKFNVKWNSRLCCFVLFLWLYPSAHDHISEFFHCFNNFIACIISDMHFFIFYEILANYSTYTCNCITVCMLFSEYASLFRLITFPKYLNSPPPIGSFSSTAVLFIYVLVTAWVLCTNWTKCTLEVEVVPVRLFVDFITKCIRLIPMASLHESCRAILDFIRPM